MLPNETFGVIFHHCESCQSWLWYSFDPWGAQRPQRIQKGTTLPLYSISDGKWTLYIDVISGVNWQSCLLLNTQWTVTHWCWIAPGIFLLGPKKNSGRITQCLASRSRLPKVFNFWGFSFLRRKLAGFCTDFHELFTKKKNSAQMHLWARQLA